MNEQIEKTEDAEKQLEDLQSNLKSERFSLYLITLRRTCILPAIDLFSENGMSREVHMHISSYFSSKWQHAPIALFH